MAIDLEGIRAWTTEGKYGDCENCVMAGDHIAALIAEVERLRKDAEEHAS